MKDGGYTNKKGYHVFLKINIDGEWIDIDATFHSALKDFYVVN